MLNCLIEEYPETITVDGIDYRIDTDFRRWIGLNEALLDKELSSDDLNYLILSLFIDNLLPTNGIETGRAIIQFLRGNIDDSKDRKGASKGKRVFSFAEASLSPCFLVSVTLKQICRSSDWVLL